MTASQSPTEPLRNHHRHLARLLGQLLELVAAARPDTGPAGVELVRAVAALERALLPHAEAEDCFLYPEVARLMADHREATAMNAEHAAVRKQLRSLRADLEAAADPKGGGLTAERLALLNQAAGRLAALIRAHFEREEQVFFPLIDERMTADEVRRLIVDPMNAMAVAVPAPPTGAAERKA
jgi:hemerythrin-like domain-containing protein